MPKGKPTKPPAKARVTLDIDIEVYLRSQAVRVLGVSPENITAGDLSTLTNRVLYEHKLAQQTLRQELIPRIFSYFGNLFRGEKVIPLEPRPQQLPENQPDNLGLISEFAAQFEDTA
ncbi:MAG: hypothetical protein F6K41_24040 [Symploca sp. SIO3E6]|nr:hypothetical protein [Caldora sp. SIO3E6]